jgi:hypothetical protein
MDKLPTAAVVLLITLACTVNTVFGQRSRVQSWSVFQYPNPQYNFQECGRQNISSVCDPSNIISIQDANAIDNLINAVYREAICRCWECTSNSRGYIIKVAILPSMERVFPDGGNTTVDLLRDTQMYSYILTTRWQMEGVCNETLLILYAKNNNTLYTLTRQQTRLVLSDSDVKQISLAVRFYFDRADTIGAGIMEMIRRYRLVFEGKRSEALRTGPTGTNG